MESNEKAKELVNKFYQPLGHLKCGVSSNEMWEYAKKCALIVIEQLLSRDEKWIIQLSEEHPDSWQISDFEKSKAIYEEVKLDIEKL